jgi:hypothetical protein
MTTSALPPLFALPPGPDRCTRIYQATLLQESPPPSYSYAATESPPIFLVTPYLLPQPHPAEAFRYTSPELPPAAFRGEVLLIADVDDPPSGHRRPPTGRRAWGRDGYGYDRDDYDPPPRTDPLRPRRDVFYHGTASLTRRTVLSFCCAAPIPILEFDGAFRGPWPVALDRIALYESTPDLHRAWRRRWDPDSWYEDVAHAPTISTAAAAPVPDPIPVLFPPDAPTSLPPIVTRPRHAPGFVTDALVRDALQRGTTCPITMEPLTATTSVAVTDCYHLFDATALATWRAAGDDKCPVCRHHL